MGVHRTRGEAGQAMFGYVRDGATQQADAIYTVPASNYVDEGRWALEMERIFKKLPLLLALSAEIPDPHDYKTMEVAGLPLLIVRGADRQARVFLNVCTHRGAILATEPRGSCSRFTCAYHGWTFASQGQLIGVSEKAKFGDLDERTRGLKALPAVERGGMIFVVLTPGAPIDVERFYGGMLNELEEFGFQDWSFCGERDVAGANWKIAFDGFIESYHFAATHPTTVAPYVVPNVMTFDTYGPHVRVGSPAVGMVDRLGSIGPEEWELQESDGFAFVRGLFPNTTIYVGAELTHFAQIFPGPTPLQNRTVMLFLRRETPASAEERERAKRVMDSSIDTIRTEDYPMNFDIQKGLKSGALDSVVFGRNEAGNQFFHKCLDYYLAEDPEAAFPSL